MSNRLSAKNNLRGKQMRFSLSAARSCLWIMPPVRYQSTGQILRLKQMSMAGPISQAVCDGRKECSAVESENVGRE